MDTRGQLATSNTLTRWISQPVLFKVYSGKTEAKFAAHLYKVCRTSKYAFYTRLTVDCSIFIYIKAFFSSLIIIVTH